MSSPFETLGLRPEFLQAIENMGYEQPTAIQLAAIPALLSGRNVLGQAQTGTGKTAAFALPLLQSIEQGKGCVQALVLAPTRELAIQVAEATSRMAEKSPVRVLAVYGGQPYYIQTRALNRGVDVVVGTPGRLIDLMHQNVLDLSEVRYVVLDEADEMLDMGFMEDVEDILSEVPDERQIALFSATLPAGVRKLADRFITDPEKIAINPTHMTVAETEQRYYRVREDNKIEALTRLLEMEDVKSALIFARTKARAQDLSDSLVQRGFPAEALHGDLSQARREFVLNRFRQGFVTLLVATDVAARGLDIENVSHVFNFDIPGDAEDYVHRIGRTGRAGRKGVAITFVHPRDRRRIAEIENYTHQKIEECRMPTPNEIAARRDDRFITHMYEQLILDTPKSARALVDRMVEMGVDLVDLAAVAINMARAGEGVLPTGEINEPVETRPGRYNKRATSEGAERGETRSTYGEPREGRGDGASRPRRDDRPQEGGYVRLRMNLGETHGLRPGDVVGAIASEVGIPGKAIGEINIFRDHTFVDVSEKHVRQVLKASSGQYQLRGRPVVLTLAS